MSNDLGEASTEGKLSLSGAPQFAEKIEDQKTAVDAPWKIAAKVTGESLRRHIFTSFEQKLQFYS